MNLPGMVLYGGTIAPGNYRGKDVTIQDVYEAVGANVAGKMSDADLHGLEDVACPGAGACGGQYTANTMSTVMEMIGLSPMGFNSVPAMDPMKDEVSFACGKVVMNVLQNGIKPRDILTRDAFENAIASVAALADRPTQFCTCWRLRVKLASNWRLMISKPSASELRCLPT